ncbi:class I SAM-dependent methyltransferase [uncultured Tateyamaria sp.]|uniref:class I SAM-dependent methyltransferase n=1 Tax=Tateyamaria sp. 1078 TaxID=3417464 RepID=UPI00261897EC|nr:class I SAM-dependent methyltransferase [uncultured Tateyamaria sp.]
MTVDHTFWDKAAPKYAQQPISDMGAYEETLARTISYLRPETRLLELGCGTGGTALRLAPHVHSVVATDFSAGMIAQAYDRPQADNVSFLKADVFSPELEAGVFDVIVGFNLFHLVEDPRSAYARIHDLLTPNGLFISKTPCIGERSLGWKFGLLRRAIPILQLLGKAPFVRYETITGLEHDITAAGFRIVETGNYPVRPPSHFVVAHKV